MGVAFKSAGFALFAGAMAACASSFGNDSSGGALQQACASYTAAFRDREYTCHGVKPEGNESTLWQRETEACVLNAQAPGETRDAAFWQAAATIIAAATATSCAGYDFAEPYGTLGVGAPCFLGSQCASDWCRGEGVTTTTGTLASDANVCGTCASRLPLGETCDSATDVCVSGASCFDGACRALGLMGDACAESSDCIFPFQCTSAGTCATAVGIGGACSGSSDCGADLSCANGSCVSNTYMLPGQACDGIAIRCERGPCDTSTGSCPAVVADGAACDPTDPTTLCDTYATCFNGTCRIVNPSACN
jgi:hypothetical protein